MPLPYVGHICGSAKRISLETKRVRSVMATVADQYGAWHRAKAGCDPAW